jgi:sugar/nucleoside kinase (ribokinase family)
MKKVCTIGSATQDILMLYEGAPTELLRIKNSECSYMLFPQGAKINIPEVHYALGGGGTNVAVGLKKLAFNVEAFFRTGDDFTGSSIREKLSHAHIETRYCKTDAENGTALSFIIPSKEQDHVALCYRAANRNMKKEDFPLSLLEKLDLLYVAPLGGQSQELLPYLAPYAYAQGVTLAVNPSIGQLTCNAHKFIDSLPYCSMLIVNTVESGYLLQALLQQKNPPRFCYEKSDRPALLQNYISFEDSDRSYSLKDIVELLRKRSPLTLAVTNGSEGVYVISSDDRLYFHPSISTDHIYSLGAGDAFNSGFIGGLTHGFSLEKSLLYGILNASSVIIYPDAQQGLLSLEILKQKAPALGTRLLKTYTL